MPAGVFAALMLAVVAKNSERVERMTRDIDVRNEYLNNEYVIARHIARAAPPHGRVLVYDVQTRRD